MEIEAFRETLANAACVPEIQADWEADLLARVEDSLDRATPLPQLPRVPTYRERNQERARAQVQAAQEPENLARRRPRTAKTRRVIDAATKSSDYDPVADALERAARGERTLRWEVETVQLARERVRITAELDAAFWSSPEGARAKLRHPGLAALWESSRHAWEGLEPLCGADVGKVEPLPGGPRPKPDVTRTCPDCLTLMGGRG